MMTDVVDGQQNEMEMIPVVEEDAIAENQQDEAESIPIVEEAIVYTDEKPVPSRILCNVR